MTMSPAAAVAIESARKVIAQARALLVLTGSGISAESGVPTFRGPGGYWRNRSYLELATPQAFDRDPRLVWDWYLERRRTVSGCEPNAAHRALARWSLARRGTLITQNVDDLHERAGHAGVVHYHGSLFRNRCYACDQEREARELHYDDLPRSACCGAVERPGVVWFGEAIPEDARRAADIAVRDADALLVVGTSAVVYPAAYLAERARGRGVPVIEVNPEETPLQAEVALRMTAAAALPAILGP